MKNSPVTSVKQAHDALLRLMPEGASHENCHLCAAEHFADQEVAHVAETTQPAVAGNVYSEAQHLSLVESAVEKATANVTAEKSELQTKVDALESEKAVLTADLAEAQSKIDVLESAKATAEAAAETAKKTFEDFKADLEKKADEKKKKEERAARVKAANDALGDTYFTDERTTRWAQMSEEAFESLISEMTEFAAAAKPAATKTATEAARESAAFTGGETPSTPEGSSALKQLLSAQQGAMAALDR